MKHLKDWIKAGRQRRVDAEINYQLNDGPKPEIPLYSHDATRQSAFNRGWISFSNGQLKQIVWQRKHQITQQELEHSSMTLGELSRHRIHTMLNQGRCRHELVR